MRSSRRKDFVKGSWAEKRKEKDCGLDGPQPFSFIRDSRWTRHPFCREMWYNPSMKSLIFLLPLIVPAAAAAGVAVGPLPAPDYADTEVSTNFAFSVGEGQSRGIVFTVELQATPSNNVEVAIGVDADGDGRRQSVP